MSSQIPEVFLATKEMGRWVFPTFFAGHPSIGPWPRIPELNFRPRAELVRSYRHGRVRQDLGFEILGLKSLCLGITRNSIEMMGLADDGTNVVVLLKSPLHVIELGLLDSELRNTVQRMRFLLVLLS